MGRAERRRLERRERIEDKKQGTIRMTRHDISRLKQETIQGYTDFRVEVLMTIFGLVLHRKLGFGQKRINAVLNEIDIMMIDYLNDDKTIEDFKRELKEETGMDVICGKGIKYD